MTSGVIIDNWALQEVGSLLAGGPHEERSSEIRINVGSDSHEFIETSRLGQQVEALFDLLVDVVLQDEIFVDSAFTDSWSETGGYFEPLVRPGLVRPFPFRDQEAMLAEPRRLLVGEICVTSTLRDVQRSNEEGWREHGRAVDQYMSALVWGAAGMLSRSHVFNAQYHACPPRKRLLEQVPLVSPRREAAGELSEWLDTERLRIYQVTGPAGMTRRATLVLPSIVTEIVAESRSPGDLLRIAYQKRDDYRVVREWLREIQEGLNSDDSAPALKFAKTLNSISRDLDKKLRATDAEVVTLDITTGFPSLNIGVSRLFGLRRRFGIGAVLNRMLLANRGGSTLRKLLSLFGSQYEPLETSLAGYLVQANLSQPGKR